MDISCENDGRTLFCFNCREASVLNLTTTMISFNKRITKVATNFNIYEIRLGQMP